MTNNSSVLYKDPLLEYAVSYDGKNFGSKKLRSTKITSRVLYKDIVIHSFKTSSTINDFELKTMVEIKMYEEAGLDLQKKYKMLHIKKELDDKNTCLVEAFAIEEEKTRATLQNILKEEKYIDFLALPFLIFSTLYTHKILAPKNDLFIHLDFNEAFVALYKNGYYISTKSIMTLNEISKKLLTEGIELNEIMLERVLKEKGLDASLYSEEESLLFNALQTIFVGIFTKISDIVMHNRNIFGFEHIDRIFMNTANGCIKGLKSFLKTFGYVNVRVYDFKFFKQASTENLLESIVAVYTLESLNLNRSENITFFVKPPKFMRTQVGKLFLVLLISVFFASLYPLYLVLSNQKLSQEYEMLISQSEALKKSSNVLNSELIAVQNDLKNTRYIEDEQIKSLTAISQTIDELYTLKLSTKSNVDFIVDVNQLLKKYNLKVRSIVQQGSNKMSLEVVATESKRDSIAKFMQDLLAQGFIGVTTDEVHSDKSLYISKIEIIR